MVPYAPNSEPPTTPPGNVSLDGRTDLDPLLFELEIRQTLQPDQPRIHITGPHKAPIGRAPCVPSAPGNRGDDPSSGLRPTRPGAAKMAPTSAHVTMRSMVHVPRVGGLRPRPETTCAATASGRALPLLGVLAPPHEWFSGQRSQHDVPEDRIARSHGDWRLDGIRSPEQRRRVNVNAYREHPRPTTNRIETDVVRPVPTSRFSTTEVTVAVAACPVKRRSHAHER